MNESPYQISTGQSLQCLRFTGDTPNTTRLASSDQYQTGVAVSEAVWANPAVKRPRTATKCIHRRQ